ncbi:UDP-Glycosyltransferase/glycogen phosphorylase, partial [Neoconidiobolus thromboides FSU 785]
NRHPKLNIVVHSAFGGRSHIKSSLEIGDALAQRGHKITYATLDDNIRFTKGYDIGNYSIGGGFLDDETMRNIMRERILDRNTENTGKAMARTLGPVFIINYERTFQPLKEYLIKSKPDLIACDFFAHPCIDLAKHLKIPLIISYQTTEGVALTMEPFVTSGFEYSPIYTKDMSFIQRFYSLTIKPIVSLHYISKVVAMENKVRQKFGIPSTNEFQPGLDYGLNLVSTFIGFEPATRSPPNLIHVGPIVSENKDLLTAELNTFLNTHENTLFIAFGSNSVLNESLTKRILEASLLAIEKGVIDGVVWGLGRTNKDDFPLEVNNGKGGKVKVQDLFKGKNDKIKLLSWAPQVSVLNHKNTKLFISHGGIESTFEAIHSGTPVLCLALFGDQPRNARKLEEVGGGLYVDKFTFTAESLKQQFKTIIEDRDNKFKSNLSRMKTISHHNSRRLNYAADLYEQHAYTAKACRKYEPYDPNSNVPPCEIKHLIPVSNQMSFIKANGIDV